MVWRHRHTSYGLGVTGDCAWLSRAKETIEASHKLRQWLVQRQQDSVSLIGHLWKQLASLDATKLCRGKEGCHLENHLDNYSSSLKCHAFLKAMWSWFCCDVRKNHQYSQDSPDGAIGDILYGVVLLNILYLWLLHHIYTVYIWCRRPEVSHSET